jgi:hypothetical protein
MLVVEVGELPPLTYAFVQMENWDHQWDHLTGGLVVAVLLSLQQEMIQYLFTESLGNTIKGQYLSTGTDLVTEIYLAITIMHHRTAHLIV